MKLMGWVSGTEKNIFFQNLMNQKIKKHDNENQSVFFPKNF